MRWCWGAAKSFIFKVQIKANTNTFLFPSIRAYLQMQPDVLDHLRSRKSILRDFKLRSYRVSCIRTEKKKKKGFPRWRDAFAVLSTDFSGSLSYQLAPLGMIDSDGRMVRPIKCTVGFLKAPALFKIACSGSFPGG